MVDKTFLKKKMKKVIANYLKNRETELSEQEIEHLIAEFERRTQTEKNGNIHFIFQDVIYDYLKKHYL